MPNGLSFSRILGLLERENYEVIPYETGSPSYADPISAHNALICGLADRSIPIKALTRRQKLTFCTLGIAGALTQAAIFFPTSLEAMDSTTPQWLLHRLRADHTNFENFMAYYTAIASVTLNVLLGLASYENILCHAKPHASLLYLQSNSPSRSERILSYLQQPLLWTLTLASLLPFPINWAQTENPAKAGEYYFDKNKLIIGLLLTLPMAPINYFSIKMGTRLCADSLQTDRFKRLHQQVQLSYQTLRHAIITGPESALMHNHLLIPSLEAIKSASTEHLLDLLVFRPTFSSQELQTLREYINTGTSPHQLVKWLKKATLKPNLSTSKLLLKWLTNAFTTWLILCMCLASGGFGGQTVQGIRAKTNSEALAIISGILTLVPIVLLTFQSLSEVHHKLAAYFDSMYQKKPREILSELSEFTAKDFSNKRSQKLLQLFYPKLDRAITAWIILNAAAAWGPVVKANDAAYDELYGWLGILPFIYFPARYFFCFITPGIVTGFYAYQFISHTLLDRIKTSGPNGEYLNAQLAFLEKLRVVDTLFDNMRHYSSHNLAEVYREVPTEKLLLFMAHKGATEADLLFLCRFLPDIQFEEADDMAERMTLLSGHELGSHCLN